MVDARAEILGRVRAALADVVTPAGEPARDYRLRSEASPAETRRLFLARAAEYKVGVHSAPAQRLARCVTDVLRAQGATTVAVPMDLPEAWRPHEVEVLEDHGGFDARRLDRLDGAVTGCHLAIAETGTVVLNEGARQGRRELSLIPDLHVCLVGADQIVHSLPEAIAALSDVARAPLTFVSGPSATSDIELTRVEGVHGPRRLELIVYE